jgi:acetyl-CoA carboxylase carboxyltransferase component
MCDYAVLVKEQAKVFLGGPPLVKMATGEDADDEALGGADMHARVSGLADYMADDELECIRIGRQIVADLGFRKLGRGPDRPAEEPVHDAEELLGIVSVNLKVPFDPREVLTRIVDGSKFSEYKPLYGPALVTGWAHIHGFRVGILANAHGVLQNEESQKATEFILLANQNDTPLIFLQNTTGYIVGTAYEQRGIIKDGAKMINAVTNSKVPHITIMMGASYGAGNYGMSGRAYDPRFVFTWPNAKTAVMGPAQLAGVMSILGRASAKAGGRPFDEQADAAMRQAVQEHIERESTALFNTGLLYDDGIIDPRDTRTVLGIALSACHSGEVKGTHSFGVFRL